MNDEELLAELDDWLNNSLFKNTQKKKAVRELIRRYRSYNPIIEEDIKDEIKKWKEKQKQDKKDLKNAIKNLDECKRDASVTCLIVDFSIISVLRKLLIHR